MRPCKPACPGRHNHPLPRHLACLLHRRWHILCLAELQRDPRLPAQLMTEGQQTSCTFGPAGKKLPASSISGLPGQEGRAGNLAHCSESESVVCQMYTAWGSVLRACFSDLELKDLGLCSVHNTPPSLEITNTQCSATQMSPTEQIGRRLRALQRKHFPLLQNKN